MGGGRKKKDKEQSFKRSDSFKRISIRKSYLDRGGKKRQKQQNHIATAIIHEEKIEVEKVEKPSKKSNNTSITEITHEPKESTAEAYGNWLKGVRISETGATNSTVKGAERTIIYIPASDDPLPIPVIRQLSASPINQRRKKSSPSLKRKESNDSAVEMFPWGESIDLQKSPILRRSNQSTSPQPQSLLPEPQTEDLCSLSVSLGRIWMDAPLAMSPRSLELPRPSGSIPQPAHHSLDSALKDRRDEQVTNRLQAQKKQKIPPVTRTLSATSSATASTGIFSSKDSGFSLSAPKLDEFTPQTKGFFKKKRPQPRLSVSRDGYFKRTSGGLFELKRNSVRRKSSRKKLRSSGKRKKQSNKPSIKNDMYQVIVSRPPRCLKSLKLDPMIFVPPEKRKPSVRRTKSFKLTVQEIREATFKDDKPLDSTDEGHYESISGKMSPSASNSDDHFYDLPSNDFAESSSVNDDSLVIVSDDDDDTSAKSSTGSAGSCYLPKITNVTTNNNRVRRKRSLKRKKSITFVAKPNVHRAHSTLRRSKKKNKSK